MEKNKKRKCQNANKNTSKDKRFKYGNYNRYYGYRNTNNDSDKRIPLLNKDWFCNKSCLDVGCNVGHLTLWIAKHFGPKKIKGVDIDTELIRAAKNNVLHYIDSASSDQASQRITASSVESGQCKETKTVEAITLPVEQSDGTCENMPPCKYPDVGISSKNSLDCNIAMDDLKTGFPYNVSFITVSVTFLSHWESVCVQADAFKKYK